MEYNKNLFRKVNDQKVLHKIGKHWVAISLSTLAALGGATAITQTATANADPVTNAGHDASVTKVTSGASQSATTLKSASAEPSSASAASQSASSTSPSSISSAANQLHTRILLNNADRFSSNASVHQDQDNQKVSFGSELTSNVASPVLGATSSGANQSSSKSNNTSNSGSNSSNQTAKNNAITVKYYDQNGNQLNNAGGVIPSQKMGSSIDVINRFGVPNGYILKPNQDPNYVFNKQPQVAPIYVQGKTISGSIDIDRIEKHTDGKSSDHPVSANVTGTVGDTVTIHPGGKSDKYIPQGTSKDDTYYLDPMDKDAILQVLPPDASHPNAYFSPNKVQFTYDEEKNVPINMGRIVVHYQDIGDIGGQGQDISEIPKDEKTGTLFDIKSYEANAPSHPYPYYYIGVKGSIPQKFGKQTTQNVTIEVKAYDHATLLFENTADHNQVVSKRMMFSRANGGNLNYPSIYEGYGPKGYSYVGADPKNDKTFQADKTEVIYVKNGKQTPVAPTVSDGTINVDYIDEYSNKTIKHYSETKPVGTMTTLTKYITDPKLIPSGYKLTEHPVIQGDGIHQFTASPQTLIIGVDPIKSGNNVVTISIQYKDLNGDSLKTINNIKGDQGAQIDYRPYEAQSSMPKGYTFAFLNGNQTFNNGDTEYIMVKPSSGNNNNGGNNGHNSNNQPKQVTNAIIYTDDQTGHQVGYAPISGPIDSVVNYAEYDNNGSQYMPQNYHFDKNANVSIDKSNVNFGAPGSGTYLEPKGVYKIVVSHDKSQPQNISTQLIYKDASDNDSIVGYAPLTGPTGSKINYSKYGNGSQYMPKGYQYNKVAPDSGDKLENGGNYIVLVNKIRQQITDKVIYRNVKDDSQVGSDLISGPSDSSVDLSGYKGRIPSGYQFDYIDPGNQPKLLPNTNYTIYVKKNNNSQPITDNVIYRNVKDNSQVGSASINGQSGSPVNLSNYEAHVPNGYNFDHLDHSNKSTLLPNTDYTIYVKATPANSVTAKIVFRNTKTGQTMQTVSDTDKPGTKINYQNYISQFNDNYQYPNGHYDVVKANGDDASLPNHDATETINVTPVQDMINGMLYYRDGNHNIKRMLISGIKGTPVNYNQYEQPNEIPSGYYVTGLGRNVNSTYEMNGNYVILIQNSSNHNGGNRNHNGGNTPQPNPNNGGNHNHNGGGNNPQPTPNNGGNNNHSGGNTPQPNPNNGGNNNHNGGNNTPNNPNNNSKIINGLIVYQDIHSGKTVKTRSISGPQGTQINYNNYTTANMLPNGYLLVTVDPHNSPLLEPNGNYTILVAAHNNGGNTPQPTPNNNGGNHNHNGGNIPQPNPNNSGNHNHNGGNNPQPNPNNGGNHNHNGGNTPQPTPNNNGGNHNHNGGNIPQPNPNNGGNHNHNGGNNPQPNPNNSGNHNHNNGGNNTPNNQPQVVNVRLAYQTPNGVIVNTVPISGSQGSNVNYSFYEQPGQLPSGYRSLGIAPNVSYTFEPNGIYSILVKKQPQQVTDAVIYRDVTNGAQVGDALISGASDSPVNFMNYENNSPYMPRGYQFDHLESNTPSKLLPNMIYTIFVKKTGNQQINTALNYIDTANNQVVKSVPLKGDPGTPVDYVNYMSSNQLPNGYRLISLGNNVSRALEPNGNYTILVAPINNTNNKPNNKPNVVDGTLYYRDNNGNVIKSLPISGQQGSNVDYTNYLQADQIPNGYHLVGLGSGTSRTFEPDADYSITIAANQNKRNSSRSDNQPSDTPSDVPSDTPSDKGNGNEHRNSYRPNGSNRGTNLNGDNDNYGNSNYGKLFGLNGNAAGQQNSNQSSNLPQTGEVHRNFEHQLSEILVMMGMSMAALGRDIDRRRHDE